MIVTSQQVLPVHQCAVSPSVHSHVVSLQFWLVGPEQVAPPFAGAGLVQVRVWVPPPQFAEHVVQSLQPPSTGPAHAAFAREQVPELLPPSVLAHTHVRVVSQAVAPLSLVAVPTEQPSAMLLLHTPLVPAHAAFAREQVPELLPPLTPAQTHVRVVPHVVALLSLEALPMLQPNAVLLSHTPFWGTAQLWLLQVWLLGPLQSLPPPEGAGFVQLRVWLPPPQVAVHALQAL